MQTSSEVHKVPIWVGTDRRVVSGVNKSTTCSEVIRSLLAGSEETPSNYGIVEKWKKMERRLESSARILKVWRAWGDQRSEVAFILRANPMCGTPSADGYIDKKVSSRLLRRKSSSHQRRASHEEKDSSEKQMAESMERLLKIVLTQGETIQAQLRKLKHQEDQIERFEHHIHQIRSLQDGENYVLDSYLTEEGGRGKKKSKRGREKSPRSKSGSREVSVVPTSTTSPGQGSAQTEEDDPEESELIERICELNSRLTQEEERLVRLGFKVKKLSELRVEVDEAPQGGISDTPGQIGPCHCDEWELESALMAELETLRTLTADQSREIELNERSLTELDQMLDNRHDELSILTHQIQLVDDESQQLKSRLLEIGHGFLVQSYAAAADIGEEERERAGICNNLESPEMLISPTPKLVYLHPEQSAPPLPKYPPPFHHPQVNSVPASKTVSSGGGSDPHSNDNDSNSDTGISSLHSSGDEHTFALDTLV